MSKKPTTIREDFRARNAKKGKTYLTDEAVEAAREYPNEPIQLGEESEKGYVDSSYAGTIAWQAENLDSDFRVYWSFQQEGTTDSGSQFYKGIAYLSYGEVSDAPNPPVEPVAPTPSPNQLASVLTLAERAKLIAVAESAAEGAGAKELLAHVPAAGRKKLAKRYWERRGMSAGVAKAAGSTRSETAKAAVKPKAEMAAAAARDDDIFS